MPDFARRSREPEWMDGDDVSPEDFAGAMKDLATVNTLTLARRPTLAFIDAALRATPANATLTVLDVGYGAGDMLRAVRRLCDRRGRTARLIGIDLNPRSEPVARATTPAAMHIEYRTGDAFALDEPLDLVISSLVTHHMEDAEILRFLGWMEERARLGWLVNDLHRHWVSYQGFRLLTSAMRWHRFVPHDGLISIARSFRRKEWDERLAATGLTGRAKVEWWFPFRFCVERRKW
ncbi:MAG: methyltransferase domain-containing protein [Novosphingobium sp.]